MSPTDRSTIEDAAYDVGIEHVDDYSGRGMYGATCFGLTVNDLTDAFKFFALLGATDEDLADDLAQRARTDSMGLGTIIYFPGYTLSED